MRSAAAVLLAAVIGVLALLGVLGGATPAAAHAALSDTSPAEGSVVATAPEEVTLTFSEKVAMSGDSVRVLDPNGDRVDTGELQEPGGDAPTYAVALRPGIPDGTFTVSWKAVSADSHPISGAFTFSVGAPSETEVTVDDQEVGGGTVGALYDAVRYAAYAGFILLVGGAVFVLACWHLGAAARPVQRLVVTGWITLTTATLALLLLRYPYTTTGSLADTFDLTGLKSVLETKPGAALVSRILLLAASALFVAVLFGAFAQRRAERTDKDQRDLFLGLAIGGTVVAAGLGATWAMAEHASSGIQPGIAMPVDVLHLLAVAVWLGGLTTLLVLLYRSPALPRSAVHRFSRLAFASVLALAATGLYQSWRQVGSWSALTSTSYGRLLIVKVGLVGLLVGLAWISRKWTARLADTKPELEPENVEEGGEEEEGADREEPEPEYASGDPLRAAQLRRQRSAVATARRKRARDSDPHRAGLRRSVLAETGVAVLVLAVTTVLTGTEPARTEVTAREASPGAAAPAQPVSVSVPFNTGGPKASSEGTAQLDLEPGRSGDNTLHIRTDVDAEEVKVSFTLADQDIGPLAVTPKRVGEDPRHWRAEDVQLPTAGEWEVALTVRTSDIDQVTETVNAEIG